MTITQSAIHRRFLTATSLILLAGTVLLVYSNTLKSPFVFDDCYKILENKAIRMTEASWGGIKTAALESQPKTRPLPNISFALNYYMGRYNVFGYHLTNILIHFATGLLLFFMVRITLIKFGPPAGSRPLAKPECIAFFAGLLWLVQPINTQAVTYTVQRMASMAAFFYILSLFLYVWGRSRWRAQGKIRPVAVLALSGCLIAGLCALVSKQNAAMLPIIILLYEWFFFQDRRITLSKKQSGWIIGGLAVFGGIVLLYLGGNPIDRILDDYARQNFTLPERVMTEWRVVIYYITLLFYPHPIRLMLDYDYPLSISPAQPATTLLCLGALVALIMLCIYLARWHRLLAFCLVWFLANMMIESSIIGLEIIYEHRTYLPFMLLIVGGTYLVLNYARPAKMALASLCIIAVTFSIWTYQRNTVWKDRIDFWTDNALKAPREFRPHTNLARALHDAGRIDAAIDQYRKSLTLASDHADTLNNLGNALKCKGRIDKAITCYMGALEIDPKQIRARINMAAIMIQKQRYSVALSYLSPIIKEKSNAEAHLNAGTALANMDRIDEAISHFKKALDIHPDIAETHNNLGVMLVQKGDLRAARDHFKTALRLKPGYKSAKQNLKKITDNYGIEFHN